MITERLDLRPLEPADLESLQAVLGDAWTMRFYPAPFDRAACETWIARNASLAGRGSGLHAVVVRDTGTLIGDCGPTLQRLPDGREETELGWHIHRDFQRQGYATEAALAWRDTLLGRETTRLISLIRPENIPSRRVAEKLGMRVVEEILWNSELRWPHLVYAIDS